MNSPPRSVPAFAALGCVLILPVALFVVPTVDTDRLLPTLGLAVVPPVIGIALAAVGLRQTRGGARRGRMAAVFGLLILVLQLLFVSLAIVLIGSGAIPWAR